MPLFCPWSGNDFSVREDFYTDREWEYVRKNVGSKRSGLGVKSIERDRAEEEDYFWHEFYPRGRRECSLITIPIHL